MNHPSALTVFFRQETETNVEQCLSNLLGIRSVLSSNEVANSVYSGAELSKNEAIFLPNLKIVLIQGESEWLRQLKSISATDNAVEATFVCDSSWSSESFEEPLTLAGSSSGLEKGNYWHGYRDAVNDLGHVSGLTEVSTVDTSFEYQDNELGTWGLHATGVLKSRYSGQGVRLAALVDGLDTAHPDWCEREVVMQSFVLGEPPTLAGSSGTHYLGNAIGNANPSLGSRYGCAPNALPYVAKVLNINSSGSLPAIFAGLDWAMSNQCRIILIPLGSSHPPNKLMMEHLTARITKLGGLLIAGSGNSARRSEGNFGQVLYPAACNSVMGIGSLDARLNLPEWTPRSAEGTKIDIVAPGVNLRSSLPHPRLYGMYSGSATAAAYAAGIAALWAEALPDANSYQLWQTLVANAQVLPLPNHDIGCGFIQAP